jgi:hypothetical protein
LLLSNINCTRYSAGFSCTLLMQGFDWLSSKEPDHGWWRTLAERAEDIAAGLHKLYPLFT